MTSQAVAKVDAIREEAMAKGCSEARLYQNQGRFRFPCGEDYGLVCFVDGDQEIGEVTESFIEIVHGPTRSIERAESATKGSPKGAKQDAKRNKRGKNCG